MQQSFNEILDQVKKLDVNQIQEVYWVTREILFEKQQKERFEKGKTKLTSKKKDAKK